MQTSHQPLLIAHRGNSIRFPENSIPAFQSAISLGADMIECDVQASKDSQLFVFHDDSLQRLTGAKGSIHQWAAKDIAKLEVTPPPNSNGPSSFIPSLDELLELARGNIRLNIELKVARQAPAFSHLVCRSLQRHGLSLDQAILSSFDRKALLALGRAHTIYPFAPIIGSRNNLMLLLRSKLPFISIDHRLLNPLSLQLLRRMGKPIYAWTVNSVARAEKLLSMGINGVMTDDPKRLLRIRK